jgi:hypothetical protein
MGSFRTSAQRRETDLRTITGDETPKDVTGDWLAPGESLTYWGVMPHSAMTKIVSAGTTAIFDRKGRPVRSKYDPDVAIRARLVLGIVDWRLLDVNGQPIPWDVDQGDALIDGLQLGVYTYLQRHIGNDGPLGLGKADPQTSRIDPATGEEAGPSVGETSGRS